MKRKLALLYAIFLVVVCSPSIKTSTAQESAFAGNIEFQLQPTKGLLTTYTEGKCVVTDQNNGTIVVTAGNNLAGQSSKEPYTAGSVTVSPTGISFSFDQNGAGQSFHAPGEEQPAALRLVSKNCGKIAGTLPTTPRTALLQVVNLSTVPSTSVIDALVAYNSLRLRAYNSKDAWQAYASTMERPSKAWVEANKVLHSLKGALDATSRHSMRILGVSKTSSGYIVQTLENTVWFVQGATHYRQDNELRKYLLTCSKDSCLVADNNAPTRTPQ